VPAQAGQCAVRCSFAMSVRGAPIGSARLSDAHAWSTSDTGRCWHETDLRSGSAMSTDERAALVVKALAVIVALVVVAAMLYEID
jgi:hypothetical protein